MFSLLQVGSDSNSCGSTELEGVTRTGMYVGASGRDHLRGLHLHAGVKINIIFAKYWMLESIRCRTAGKPTQSHKE